MTSESGWFASSYLKLSWEVVLDVATSRIDFQGNLRPKVDQISCLLLNKLWTEGVGDIIENRREWSKGIGVERKISTFVDFRTTCIGDDDDETTYCLRINRISPPFAIDGNWWRFGNSWNECRIGNDPFLLRSWASNLLSCYFDKTGGGAFEPRLLHRISLGSFTWIPGFCFYVDFTSHRADGGRWSESECSNIVTSCVANNWSWGSHRYCRDRTDFETDRTIFNIHNICWWTQDATLVVINLLQWKINLTVWVLQLTNSSIYINGRTLENDLDNLTWLLCAGCRHIQIAISNLIWNGHIVTSQMGFVGGNGAELNLKAVTYLEGVIISWSVVPV